VKKHGELTRHPNSSHKSGEGQLLLVLENDGRRSLLLGENDVLQRYGGQKIKKAVRRGTKR